MDQAELDEQERLRTRVCNRRKLTSAANFFLGEVLKLRPEDGGGTWVVVKLLPRTKRWSFARCLAERRAA